MIYYRKAVSYMYMFVLSFTSRTLCHTMLHSYLLSFLHLNPHRPYLSFLFSLTLFSPPHPSHPSIHTLNSSPLLLCQPPHAHHLPTPFNPLSPHPVPLTLNITLQVSLITKKVPEGSQTTVYKCGPLIDLCMGPHVSTTGKIKVS